MRGPLNRGPLKIQARPGEAGAQPPPPWLLWLFVLSLAEALAGAGSPARLFFRIVVLFVAFVSSSNVRKYWESE